MAKERLTLSIEENLLEKSKEVVPNISQFVEECLAKRIGWGTEAEFPIHSAEEELDKIGTSMVNLHIMTEKQDLFKKHQELEDHKLDLIWTTIFNKYRRNEDLSFEYLQEASENLGVSSEVLSDVLYLAENEKDFKERQKYTTWKSSYQKYLEFMESEQ